MAEAAEIPEVQDDDQWLYGDDKDENQEEGEIDEKAGEEGTEETPKENGEDDVGKENEDKMEEGGEEGEKGEKDETDKANEAEKDVEEDKPADEDDDDDDDDDSDEDGMAITIGPLKKQTDVIQAPTAHPAKFQPKAAPTAGLKDEDFTAVGKINGVPVTEFRIDDFEDKPWRKPGADLSDYFNYGFNEETWFKYCERQKQMRMSESGAGLGGLGIGVNSNKPNYQPFTNNTSIPVSIVNDNSKYGIPPNRKFAGPPPRAFNKDRGSIDVIGTSGNKSGGNTITVMTADRREYSNKIVGNQNLSTYGDDMDFGGNPYGDTYVPPPDPGMYYGGPGPFNNQGWTGGDWDHSSGPPPGMPPGPPPIMPPVSGPPGYFNNEDSMGAHSTGDRDHGGQGDNDRQRSRRSERSRSRSPSRRHRGDRDRDRHRSQSHRSRSRSPSHRHKRKKSKRERDAD